MEDWSAGYVSEIDYTFGFYREMAPALLSLVGLLRGQQGPDPAGNITYCELGCGQGLTANILAAANPSMQVYATDFNPGQIAGARALAAEAQLGNVHFYDESFESFADAPGLPAEGFDIIALHGIYSWVNTEARAAITAFIRRRLKVGGLVYISYNTLPGWAGVAPLRRLMIDHAAESQGPLTQRIGGALDFAERVMLTRARFFMSNPPVVERFDRIRAAKINYVAHEYFNRDWTPFYAADVAADMAGAKLAFLGSATLGDHVDSFNFTPEQQAVLSERAESEHRETLKDVMLNQYFRRDTFHKGALRHTAGSLREAWLNQRFVLAKPRADIPMKVMSFIGEVDLEEHVYAPLLDALASGPKTLRDALLGRAVDQALMTKTIEALAILIGLGHIEPCLSAKDDAKRARTTRALNQAILARATESSDIAFLASPVTGSGVQVLRFQQLFLRALQQGHKTPDDWAGYVWKILQAQGQGVVKDGELLKTAEENLAELKRLAGEFAARELGVLRGLGVA